MADPSYSTIYHFEYSDGLVLSINNRKIYKYLQQYNTHIENSNPDILNQGLALNYDFSYENFCLDWIKDNKAREDADINENINYEKENNSSIYESVETFIESPENCNDTTQIVNKQTNIFNQYATSISEGISGIFNLTLKPTPSQSILYKKNKSEITINPQSNLECSTDKIQQNSFNSQNKTLNEIPIDINEFLNQSTSPFDDLELKTVNDYEELKSILGHSSKAIAQTSNTQPMVNSYNTNNLTKPYLNTANIDQNLNKSQVIKDNFKNNKIYDRSKKFKGILLHTDNISAKKVEMQNPYHPAYPYNMILGSSNIGQPNLCPPISNNLNEMLHESNLTSKRLKSTQTNNKFKDPLVTYSNIKTSPYTCDSISAYNRDSINDVSYQISNLNNNIDQKTSNDKKSQNILKNSKSMTNLSNTGIDFKNVSLNSTELSQSPYVDFHPALDLQHSNNTAPHSNTVRSNRLSIVELLPHPPPHHLSPKLSHVKKENKTHHKRKYLLPDNSYNIHDLISRTREIDAMVSSIVSMGFERSLTASGVEYLGTKQGVKLIVDHLCSVNAMYDKDSTFSKLDCQKALFLNELDENKALKFLTSLHTLYHYGFPVLAIERALLNFDNDLEKSLEHLIREGK
ncbi:unnamed protein product [Gordionus sp. m RMFG-2023]